MRIINIKIKSIVEFQCSLRGINLLVNTKFIMKYKKLKKSSII